MGRATQMKALRKLRRRIEKDPRLQTRGRVDGVVEKVKLVSRRKRNARRILAKVTP